MAAKLYKFPTPEERLARDPNLYEQLCWPHYCSSEGYFSGLRVWVFKGEACACCGEQFPDKKK